MHQKRVTRPRLSLVLLVLRKNSTTKYLGISAVVIQAQPLDKQAAACLLADFSPRETIQCPLTTNRERPRTMLLRELLVLGSWVGVRCPFQLSLFLTAPRMVLPKILVLGTRHTCLLLSFFPTMLSQRLTSDIERRTTCCRHRLRCWHTISIRPRDRAIEQLHTHKHGAIH